METTDYLFVAMIVLLCTGHFFSALVCLALALAAHY